MGEGTTRIASSNGSNARVRELGNETEAVRRQLDDLVMELDRRRHRAFDWRLQLQRHARAIALTGIGLATIIAVVASVSVARRRRQHTLAERLSELADRGERLRRALGRVIENPDRLAAIEPSDRCAEDRTAAMFAYDAARSLLPHVSAALLRRSVLGRW
jgi:hypothetical protein